MTPRRCSVAALALGAVVSFAAAAPKSTRLRTTFDADRWFLELEAANGGALSLYTDSGGGSWIYDVAAERAGLEVQSGDIDGSDARYVQFAPLATAAGAPDFGAADPRTGVARGTLSVRPYRRAPGDVQYAGFRDGMLGQEWFAGGVWTFDYPNRALWRHPDAEALAFPRAHTVKLGFKPGLALASLTATIDGELVPFLFDTGAMIRLTPEAHAALADDAPVERATSFLVAGRFDAWRAEHPDWRVVENADAHADGEPMMEIPTIRIAGFDTGPVWFTRRDDQNFHTFMAQWMDVKPDGALGGSALRELVVDVDYPGERARFRRVAGAAR